MLSRIALVAPQYDMATTLPSDYYDQSTQRDSDGHAPHCTIPDQQA